VEVHDHGEFATPAGIHRLDADVTELDENGLTTRTSKRSDIDGRDLVGVCIPSPPIRNRVPAETNELGQPPRRLERRTIEEERAICVAVNDRHPARETLGMRPREMLARIVPLQMNLTKSEPVGHLRRNRVGDNMHR
jgi:hypothetical protein